MLPTPSPFSMYAAPTEKHPSGKRLLLLGEAPGEQEMLKKAPFVGASGELLSAMLKQAGLRREQFHITNVFSRQPPKNLLKEWTLTKTDLKKLGYPLDERLPPWQNRYFHPDREPEVARLARELTAINPDFVICLGGTAVWALTGDSRITQHRGNFFTPSRLGLEAATAIATYHPAGVLREWSWRPLVWADLKKANRYLTNTLEPELTCRVWINPTPAEIEAVYERFARAPADLLGVDIETSPRSGQITTFAIGTASECICIPLWNPAALPELSCSYGSPSEERAAWRWIKRFCELPNPKVMQNGLYDMQWLIHPDYGIRVRNVRHDTAILQHALQPELPKDLGTLGSLYLNVPAWKIMRTRAKDEVKADE